MISDIYFCRCNMALNHIEYDPVYTILIMIIIIDSIHNDYSWLYESTEYTMIIYVYVYVCEGVREREGTCSRTFKI